MIYGNAAPVPLSFPASTTDPFHCGVERALAQCHRCTSHLYGRLAEYMGECEEDELVAELPLREGHRLIDNNRNRTGVA